MIFGCAAADQTTCPSIPSFMQHKKVTFANWCCQGYLFAWKFEVARQWYVHLCQRGQLCVCMCMCLCVCVSTSGAKRQSSAFPMCVLCAIYVHLELRGRCANRRLVGAASLSTHCSIREYAGGSVRSIAHENCAKNGEPTWQTATATVVCIYNIGLQPAMQSLYVNTTHGCALACKVMAA